MTAYPLGGAPMTVMVAEEAAIAISYGGVPYAVMMASPADLTDFAVGFSITEGVVPWMTAQDDLRAIDCHQEGEDRVIQIALAPNRLHAFLARHRQRNLRGHTSCGLCGVQDLAEARQVTPPAPAGEMIDRSAIVRALAALADHQPLSRRTRAAHAAAWVSKDGAILCVREDVGRHTALDKLIGAVARQGNRLDRGFVLITSRTSHEMVQKALMAGVATLVAISAPTALAIRDADRAGLTLVAMARPDRQICYTGSARLTGDEDV